ncbi:MAG: GNAT family N-acetyltransferase [Methylophilus sp.]|nr:GNAT family N-acetyltransferase [Methylophilus sp.]
MNSTPPIHISDANIDDIPALVGLLNILFSIEQDFSPNKLRQEAGLRLIIENPHQAIIKVARTQGGLVIGMVSAQLVISTSQGSNSAWIEDMVVREQYRAQGLGRQLLDAALQWAKDKGATRAQLLVDLDNKSAIGYYEHLGWHGSRMGMRRLLLE